MIRVSGSGVQSVGFRKHVAFGGGLVSPCQGMEPVQDDC